MALDLKKFLDRFIEEAREHLARMGAGLEALERAPSDTENINLIFRCAHTIKGSARMLKLITISDTAHHLEDLLSVLRDGSLAYSPELGRLLFRATDAIAALVEMMAAGTPLPAADVALCEALAQAAGHRPSALTERVTTVPEAQQQETLPDAPNAFANPSATAAIPAAPAASVAPKSPETVRVRLSKLDELIKLMGEVVASHARARQRLADLRELEFSRHGKDQAALTGNLAWQRQRAKLHQFSLALRDDVLTQELLMDELHSKILIMRMLPLAMVFDPVGRMLRELAAAMGKQVECIIVGAEMELDRQIIDKLGEPVMHMLRNALDHGIEPPAERLAAGKPACGKLTLTARQEGGAMLIEIGDDGAGINQDSLRQKALRLGLLSTERATSMTAEEILDLIFLPGFSTSPIITDISGRGVGMDVVKRCIVDELQGEISIATHPGLGSTFTLRLPMSLALMRVLLVTAGSCAFGFIAQNVVELLRVPEADFLLIGERRVVIIRNEFVPIVTLAALLNLPQQAADATLADVRGAGCLLLVVRVRNEKLALLIDTLADERDMVVKSLPKHMQGLPMVSGMVTTGRDELVNILHVPALMEKARTSALPPSTQEQVVRQAARILVVDDSLNTREIEKDVLEAHGYQVTLAEDGQDGLRKALATEFDAILTDIEMPNMDGFALTERLRQEEKYRAIPIIIITSRAKEEDKRRGVQAGADAYIVKGDFEQNNLVEILRKLLG